jgi:hypothetical protein
MLHKYYFSFYNLKYKLNIYICVHFILSFKVMYLNAWGWSVQPKHAAYIDEGIKFVVVDGSTYVNFNMIYRNGMNSTKIVIEVGRLTAGPLHIETQHNAEWGVASFFCDARC